MRRLSIIAAMAGVLALGACCTTCPVDKPYRGQSSTRMEIPSHPDEPLGRPPVPSQSSAENNAIDLKDAGIENGSDPIMER